MAAVQIADAISSDLVSYSLPSSADLSDKERKKMKGDLKRKEKEVKEKDHMKKQKLGGNFMKKATKLSECQKCILVKIDCKLLERTEGSEIISKLLSLDVSFEVTEQLIPYLVTFYHQEPLMDSEQTEEESIIVIPVEDFLPQIYNQIYGEIPIGNNSCGTLCDNCSLWKMMTNSSSLTLIVCNLDDYYRKVNSKTRKNFCENVLSEIGNNVSGQMRKEKTPKEFLHTKVSKIDVETALAIVQIEKDVNVRLLANPSNVADYIGQVAKAVAERPHKLNKIRNDFTWYAEGSNNQCVKIDQSAVGLLKLWQQQLKQFSNVGIETVQAIAKQYPCPQDLLQAYRALHSRDCMKLLADIRVRRGVGVLANTRKVGIELSKKVHKFFTEKGATISL